MLNKDDVVVDVDSGLILKAAGLQSSIYAFIFAKQTCIICKNFAELAKDLKQYDEICAIFVPLTDEDFKFARLFGAKFVVKSPECRNRLLTIFSVSSCPRTIVCDGSGNIISRSADITIMTEGCAEAVMQWRQLVPGLKEGFEHNSGSNDESFSMKFLIDSVPIASADPLPRLIHTKEPIDERDLLNRTIRPGIPLEDITLSPIVSSGGEINIFPEIGEINVSGNVYKECSPIASQDDEHYYRPVKRIKCSDSDSQLGTQTNHSNRELHLERRRKPMFIKEEIHEDYPFAATFLSNWPDENDAQQSAAPSLPSSGHIKQEITCDDEYIPQYETLAASSI